MYKILTLIVLSFVGPSISDNLSETKPSPTPFTDWDYIVYSQRWPITGCSEWKERSPKNTCNLPSNIDTWTVHGLWPTKTGTNGPAFCNSAIHFDPDQLQPIMKELEQSWPNIEANTKPTSFWKHEWNKHGTCAASLPQLNSVTNYFKQGLQWNQDYNLVKMLSNGKIIPGTEGYNISDIYSIVQNAINKTPAIQCVVDGKTKQSLISEIQICFNKSLDLIDCITDYNGGILTNCNGKHTVMYYASLPNNVTTSDEAMDEIGFNEEEKLGGCLENYFYQKNLLKLYGIIKFLMWFTL